MARTRGPDRQGQAVFATRYKSGIINELAAVDRAIEPAQLSKQFEKLGWEFGNLLYGTVIDATTGCGIVYPWPRDARVLWRYDLLIKNGDEWCYVFSSNNLNSETFRRLARSVESGGGIWRVVVATTGEIVRQSPAEHLCLS